MAKNALVTGAGIRLGREIALGLARDGYDVAVHYSRSAEGAASVVSEIKAMGRNAVALRADFFEEIRLAELVGAASVALGGPLSVLVNNASVFEYDTIHSATRESWDRHMDSNLRAPFVLTQQFAAQAPKAIRDPDGAMRAQAVIINMVDQRVKKLTPEFMTYTLAKMGLWALTQTSARALAPDIRVNAIAPGTTVKGVRQSDDHFEGQRENTLLQRGSNPADIVATVSYILNNAALTGQVIAVDGGQHLAWQSPDIRGVE